MSTCVGLSEPGGGLFDGCQKIRLQAREICEVQAALLRCGVRKRCTHLEVYFGSQRMALAVVSLFAIVRGEGGLVLARDAAVDEGAP